MASLPSKIARAIVRTCIGGGLALLATLSGAPRAFAEIIPAQNATHSEVSVSSGEGQQYDISGGQTSSDGVNLFHQFVQFDLETGQSATFITGPTVQNVLSYVTGAASYIDGLLRLVGSEANLYFINPSGILLGPQAQLNLPGSFHASTATAISFGDQWLDLLSSDLTQASFSPLLGQPTGLNFATAGPLINLGHLAVAPGESITLSGGNLLNGGSLTAPGGNITLTALPAGNLIRLSQPNHLLALEILPSDGHLPGTSAQLTPLSLAQLLTGGQTPSADSLVAAADGTFRLVNRALPVEIAQNPGTTLVSGQLSTAHSAGEGGTINLFGERVGLIGATLDASGERGGGTLRIGGDYRGGLLFPTAQQTYLDPDSRLMADALGAGDGGDIYLWSKLDTQFYGHLSAQGGQSFGNGGFAEISGEQGLTFAGSVDLTAARGDLGHLLLDPRDIVIKSGAGVDVLGPASLPEIFSTEAAGLPLIIFEETLEQFANITLEATRDIEIENLPDNALTFQPGGRVVFRADADQDGNGRFVMKVTQGSSTDTIWVPGGRLEIYGSGLELGQLSTAYGGMTGEVTLESTNGIRVGEIDVGQGNLNLFSDSVYFREGENSVTARTITLAPANPQSDIYLADPSASDGFRLYLDDLAALKSVLDGSLERLFIGRSEGTGRLFLTEDFASHAAGILERPITLQGSAQGTLVSLMDQTHWHITGENQGNLSEGLAFAGMGNFVGGSGSDRFEFQTPQARITQAIDGGEGDLILMGDSIHLGDGDGAIARVQGSGRLQIYPQTPGTGIRLGGEEVAGLLHLGLDELAALADGFTTIEIGDGSTGAISLGGDVDFNLDFSDPLRLRSQATIDTTAGTLRGLDNASLQLLAGGDIATGNLSTADGGIELVSNAGSITARALTSHSEGQLHDLRLSAPGNITVETLLRSQSEALSGSGRISVDTQGQFLATGSQPLNGVPTSIANTNGGEIFIRYQSPAPFYVGGGARTNTSGFDPTLVTSTNSGSAGQITNFQISLADQALFGNFSQDNLHILTQLPPSLEPPVVSAPSVPSSSPPSSGAASSVPRVADSTLSRTLANLGIASDPILGLATSAADEENSGSQRNPTRVNLDGVAEGLSGVGLSAETFSQIESQIGQEFSQYLGLPVETSSNQPATLQQVQETLARVRDQKGIRPALLYAYFVAEGAEPTDSSFSKEAVSSGTVQSHAKSASSDRDDRLEIMLITAEGEPVRFRHPQVTRAEVATAAADFRRQVTSQFSRPNQYLPPAQKFYQWLLLPVESELSRQQVDALAFVMDDGLRTLPIAAIHDGEKFLVENYTLGLMPTFSLTDFGGRKPALNRPPSATSHRVLAMGASQFNDQPPLPAVRAELDFIAERLGTAFLNEAFTRENLVEQIASQRFDTIHLATHADFKPGDWGRSYIQLWDQRLSLSEVQALGLAEADINLIILSACSTALGDRRSEYGFAGFAVSAGSEAALASLWPVSDEGTLGFMTQFYSALAAAPIRAAALRQAQVAMLSGQVGIHQGNLYGPEQPTLSFLPTLAASGSWDFSHPFYWSAFTMIGNPW